MKKILKFLILIFLFFPLIVNANILCNDGTYSPSCTDCHQGCCSHHGGCASSVDKKKKITTKSYSYNKSNNSYSSYSTFDDSSNSDKSDISDFDAILILGTGAAIVGGLTKSNKK